MKYLMSGDGDKDSEFDDRVKAWEYRHRLTDGRDSVAPYVPTPQSLVNTMLRMAEAGPGDIVYDLGCGDGRFLITAVNDFKVDSAVGFEISDHLTTVARDNVEKKELSDKIKIVNTDFMDADFSEATLVTIYLTTSGNAKLRPKFKKELKDGARIISHDFPITDWFTVNEENEPVKVGTHKVYYYKVPDAYTKKTEKESSGDRWGRIKKLFERL
jgi:ubiquinone/menaquinone biosynthesis C-methylase UbiE